MVRSRVPTVMARIFRLSVYGGMRRKIAHPYDQFADFPEACQRGVAICPLPFVPKLKLAPFKP